MPAHIRQLLSSFSLDNTIQEAGVILLLLFGAATLALILGAAALPRSRHDLGVVPLHRVGLVFVLAIVGFTVAINAISASEADRAIDILSRPFTITPSHESHISDVGWSTLTSRRDSYNSYYFGTLISRPAREEHIDYTNQQVTILTAALRRETN